MLFGNSRPFIIALDVASNCGVAEGYAGETPRLYSERMVKDGDDHDDAYGRCISWMARRLLVDRPDLIVIEAPIPAAAMNGRTNADTIAMLIGMAACMGGTAKAKGIMVRRVNIQRVRKNFLGVGNLKGPEAKRRTMALCKSLGWEPPNHDAADAAACWHLACTDFAPKLAHLVSPLLLKLNQGAGS